MSLFAVSRAGGLVALWLLGGAPRPAEAAASAAFVDATSATVTATVPATVPATVTATVPATEAPGVAWRQASTGADIDAAFALARRDDRPVFVYWGARWCPPCNQVKATLFNRQDFIERSRAFVAVYVDGDSPGAQRLGARFKVSGYPTMLLFSSRGTELTRLPGEVDAARYTEVLTLGMNAQRPVKELLARALAGGAGLSPNDWRLLAFYSWDTDHQQLVPEGGVAPLLRTLAAACPPDPPETSGRLKLQALAASDTKTPPPASPPPWLSRLLADPAAARAQMDVLVGSAAAIVRAASARGTPPRAELLAAVDAELKRLQADPTLSRADRLSAFSARVDLVRIDVPKPGPGAAPAEPRVPAALLAELRDAAAGDDREITDGYERQAVVTAAADTLAQAGLGAEADALLTANLPKSHSPYYLMSMLSRHAKARGDTAAALAWSARAFEVSDGPATRLQWGASDLALRVELAPADGAAIEKTAARLFAEAGASPDAFYERSGRSLRKVGAILQDWNAHGAHAAAMRRLQVQLDAVCRALPAGDPGRPTCERLLAPAGAHPT